MSRLSGFLGLRQFRRHAAAGIHEDADAGRAHFGPDANQRTIPAGIEELEIALLEITDEASFRVAHNGRDRDPFDPAPENRGRIRLPGLLSREMRPSSGERDRAWRER